VTCAESCLHGVCTCTSGLGSCPAACGQCSVRLDGGVVCTDGPTATSCDDDNECQVGSVCINVGGGIGRCSKPCA
jgi:hypothetical protein